VAFNGANIDVAISSRASAAALALHDVDIKALIAALNDISASDVWTYSTRTLTSPTFGNLVTKNLAHIIADEVAFNGADIATILSAIQNATYGLAALNTDLDTLLARLTATRAGYLDNLSGGAVALASVCTEVRLAELGATNLPADIDKLVTGVIQGSGTVLPSNKSLYDILWVDRYADSSGSFTFPSGDTSEKILSDIGGPSFTGTTRRKYMVYLDMTNPVQDGAAWTTCTIKVKIAIDGTSYRTIDKASKTKTGLGSSEEPGIPIEIPPVAQNAQITMQFDVALQANRTIYYHIVQENMEY